MSSERSFPPAPNEPSDEGRRFWKAAIAHLAPEKREAAWDFYLDRLESSAAADTLGGVMLLLEAHLAFFDDFPARLGSAAQQIETALRPLDHPGAPSGLPLASHPSDSSGPHPSRRPRHFARLFAGMIVAVLGGIAGCGGTIAYQRLRAAPSPNHPTATRCAVLSPGQVVGIEPWNDSATGRLKGCVVRLSHVATIERNGADEARICVLSPVEEVRENVRKLQQLAR